MLRDGALCCLLLLALLLAGESRAVSLLWAKTELCVGICVDGPVDTGAGATSSFSYDSGIPDQNLLAEARVAIGNYDSFGLLAEAKMDFVLGPGQAPQFFSQGITSRAWIQMWDELTVSGGSGVGLVRMHWRISGGVDIGFVGSDAVVTGGGASQLAMICTSNVGSTLLNCNDPSFGFPASQAFDELVTLDVQVVFGTPTQWFFDARLISSIGFQADVCPTCPVSFSGRANADFSSTATLVDVQLFDGAGLELDPSGIQAESMFRYDLVGQNVAEPLGIAWAALAGLSLVRRRAVLNRCGTRGSPPAQSGGWFGCCADVSGPGSVR